MEDVRFSTEKRHVSTEKLDFYDEAMCFCREIINKLLWSLQLPPASYATGIISGSA